MVRGCTGAAPAPASVSPPQPLVVREPPSASARPRGPPPGSPQLDHTDVRGSFPPRRLSIGEIRLHFCTEPVRGTPTAADSRPPLHPSRPIEAAPLAGSTFGARSRSSAPRRQRRHGCRPRPTRQGPRGRLRACTRRVVAEGAARAPRVPSPRAAPRPRGPGGPPASRAPRTPRAPGAPPPPAPPGTPGAPPAPAPARRPSTPASPRASSRRSRPPCWRPSAGWRTRSSPRWASTSTSATSSPSPPSSPLPARAPRGPCAWSPPPSPSSPSSRARSAPPPSSPRTACWPRRSGAPGPSASAGPSSSPPSPPPGSSACCPTSRSAAGSCAPT